MVASGGGGVTNGLVVVAVVVGSFGWEMLGQAAPPRRTGAARAVGPPKRLVPEADGKCSLEERVGKSFKHTF